MTTIILVIVGIILAAAAALMVVWYGGDAYEGGSVKAQAATILNNVQNVAYAIKMRSVAEGSPTAASGTLVDQLVGEGWLASVPRNSTGGSPIFVQDQTGGQTGRAHIVVAVMPHSTESREVCHEVARQARTQPHDANMMPTAGAGCAFVPSDDKYWVVFARVR